MIAFDTDVLSHLLIGNPRFVARAASIPHSEQCVPIVVVAEAMRGRLHSIRQAESDQGKLSIDMAYGLFMKTLEGVTRYTVLPYDTAAESCFQTWRTMKLKVGSQDLRIAATCVAHDVTLVTRNARDFTLVPGLKLDIWN